ncbi:MAG: hypothetical protein GX254_09640 [Clostridiales bacterium]|nr:hypothetical protein [Clostridiales bacterium]
MKKMGTGLFALLLAAMLIAGSLAYAAYAPQYTQEADALKELGLFMGSDKGYELEREPNRTEALVLLIRLLGKEAEAEACSYANPFEDIPDWADRHVAWAYAQGLAKGYSDTQFGGKDRADAKMFITFVLRALGYDDDAGDFSYEEAPAKAEEIGLISPGVYGDGSDFYRDDCVHICYSALTKQIKGNENSLAEKLAAEGAISLQTARNLGLVPEYTGDIRELTVACVGDSLTFGMGADNPDTESYPGILATLTGPYKFTTENYGHSGATVDYESFLAYANTQAYKDSLNTEADIVLIMLGTNDAVWSPNQTDFPEDYRQILETYLNLPHSPRVIAMTPPHLFIQGFGDLLEDVVEDEKTVINELGLDIINIYEFSENMSKYSEDGVHFTSEGYKVLAEYIYNELCAVLSE